MNPEQLKVIAEGMGYEVVVIRDHVWYDYDEYDLTKAKVYYPLTNNDQMVEIMEKLARTNSLEIKITLGCNPLITYDFTNYYAGKTINEAVCNAAYEYFKAV